MSNENQNISRRDPVLVCKAITKSFKDSQKDLEVLSGLSLSIYPGERVAIIGASGSGKTTLLQIMGGLDNPTSGEVLIDGQLLNKTNEAEKCKIRNEFLGFVYQFHHLLAEFSAQENVAMPLLIRGLDKRLAMKDARHLLRKVGLEERLLHRPSELSGGERQRAAVARALITKPKIILADEPTGNLDSGNGGYVMQLMLELHREFKTSLVVVTHDLSIANKMDRTLQLKDGLLA